MATVGNTATPNSEFGPSDFIWGTELFTASADYNVSSAHIWQSGSTAGRCIVRVYNNSGNTIGTSAEIASSNASGAFDSGACSFTITNGTQFRIALISNQSANIGITTPGAGSNKFAKSAGGIVYPTFDGDPVTFDFNEAGDIAIYLTYTTGGASGTFVTGNPQRNRRTSGRRL